MAAWFRSAFLAAALVAPAGPALAQAAEEPPLARHWFCGAFDADYGRFYQSATFEGGFQKARVLAAWTAHLAGEGQVASPQSGFCLSADTAAIAREGRAQAAAELAAGLPVVDTAWRMVAEGLSVAQDLNRQVLRHDAAIVERNAQAEAAYQASLAEHRAAQADYEAKARAADEARAQYERERAAWEARVAACQAGDRTQCGPQP